MKRITGDDIKKGLNRIKYNWVDEVLKRELPPHIYTGMHYKDPDAAAWMKERGYRIEHDGNMVEIKKGFRVLGRKFMTLDIQNWEEMDVIVKAVGKINPPQKVEPDVQS